MRNVSVRLRLLIKDDRGLTTIEYAVAAGLITATLAATMTAFGLSIDAVFATVNNFLTP